MPKITEEQVQFYRGITAALTVVAHFDEETIFREIVATVDESFLVRIARRDGTMRWSGLSKYRYGRGKEGP